MENRKKDGQSLVKESLEASLNDFSRLIGETVSLLRDEPRRVSSMLISGHLIEVSAEGEAIVVGDLHGDLETLAQILSASEFTRKAELGEPSRLIFLGDYGDRGALSPEVYYVVMSLKVSFPERVILLRGNHEGPEDLQASPHDLPMQLHDRFGEKSNEAYARLRQLFSLLYNAVLVRDSCILLHGGVPSEAKLIDDVAYAHTKHPLESHLEEILWSDPQEGLKGTVPSPRGAGKLFGQDVTEGFLKKMHVNMLIRGHEPADAGFKISHDGRILTIFSRKGEPYFNSQAAFLQLDLTKKIKNAFQLERFLRQLQ
jgi:protein phosphatase